VTEFCQFWGHQSRSGHLVSQQRWNKRLSKEKTLIRKKKRGRRKEERKKEKKKEERRK